MNDIRGMISPEVSWELREDGKIAVLTQDSEFLVTVERVGARRH